MKPTKGVLGEVMHVTRVMVVVSGMLLFGCRDEKPAPPSPAPVESSAPVLVPGPGTGRSDLEKRLRAMRKTKGDYAPASGERATAFERWLDHLALSVADRQLPQLAPPNGFAGELTEAGQVWLLGEVRGTNTGAGAVALRVAARNEVIVQAPHTFFDEGTLPLAVTVFDELGARALMINTVHRAGSAGDKGARLARVRAGDAPADLAHLADSLYQRAHLTLTQRWKDAKVIQLHGFRDEQVPGVSIIVSASRTQWDPAPVARALSDVFGAGSARTYPQEVKKLGGTTNVQARSDVRVGREFLHLEISTSLRKRLERQPSLRREFALALSKALLLR